MWIIALFITFGSKLFVKLLVLKEVYNFQTYA